MKNNLLSKHAKSFNWAGFFLSRETYKKCSLLYDFCRTLDDIADEEISLENKKRKFVLKEILWITALFSSPGGLPQVQRVG